MNIGMMLVSAIITTSFVLTASAQPQVPAAASAASAGHTERSFDRMLARKVRRALANAKGLNPIHIYVKVARGVVTLNGYCSSQQELEQAVNIAGSLAGVSSVENRLSVKSGTGDLDKSIDGIRGY